MDFSTNLKIQIIKLVTKLAEYEASFTVGTIIDVLYQNGYWPKNINRVNAYFRVQEIIDNLIQYIDYDSYIEDMVNVYVPKRVIKELEEEEREKNLTEDDIINMTINNIKIDNTYEFNFPKFNQFWNKGWEKFF